MALDWRDLSMDGKVEAFQILTAQRIKGSEFERKIGSVLSPWSMRSMATDLPVAE